MCLTCGESFAKKAEYLLPNDEREMERLGKHLNQYC